MIKRLLICSIGLLISTIAFAQRFSENPFRNLTFPDGPTETLTIVALYNGIVDSIDYKNRSIIGTIKRHKGKVVNNLKYSVDLIVPGYDSKIKVACKDDSTLDALKGLTTNTPINIKCVVYRFYSYDGICNFFYIDKVTTTKSI